MPGIGRQSFQALVNKFSDNAIEENDQRWGRQLATMHEFQAMKLRSVFGSSERETKPVKLTDEIYARLEELIDEATEDEEQARVLNVSLADLAKLKKQFYKRQDKELFAN